MKYGDFMGFLDEQSESFHVASLFFLEQTRFFFFFSRWLLMDNYSILQ